VREVQSAAGEQVLVVEDDAGLRRLIIEELAEAGLQVRGAASAEEAAPILQEWEPDLVISDLRLPGADGIALLRHGRERHAAPSFLIITAFGTVAQAVAALKAGADEFLTKPLDLEHLLLTVRRLLETRRLREEVQRFRGLLAEESFHGLIGSSRPMRVLFDQIAQLARADGPVLIVGESGTGKELVARAVHERSERAKAPFLAVNCAGIPGELLESEFFGHEAGAFTGGQKAHKGIFRQAHQGTLFLDEIGEMPMALQAKLLRVLQDGMIRPVGSEREQPVDVRIVAATHRDLQQLIADGRFREDLFFRLETFTVGIPPLREREDDLGVLAHHFLRHHASRMGRDCRGLTEAAWRRLARYPFPGNVRELQNAMERAVTFCHGRLIEPDQLPARIRDYSGDNDRAAGAALLGQLVGGEFPSLAELEQRYIHHVLESHGGNKRRAAATLGIGRRTLYRRLGLEEDADR
jgi:two-component system response regulator AtoC